MAARPWSSRRCSPATASVQNANPPTGCPEHGRRSRPDRRENADRLPPGRRRTSPRGSRWRTECRRPRARRAAPSLGTTPASQPGMFGPSGWRVCRRACASRARGSLAVRSGSVGSMSSCRRTSARRCTKAPHRGAGATRRGASRLGEARVSLGPPAAEPEVMPSMQDHARKGVVAGEPLVTTQSPSSRCFA